MRIETPRGIERFGPIVFHDVQKVYELDSGLKNIQIEEDAIVKRFSYESMHNVQEQMAIVVPVMNERIRLIEGVLSGIPHHCLTIVVSNSPTEPIDRFHMERDALIHLGIRFMKKNMIIVHQKDPLIGQAFANAGYNSILDDNGIVKKGKAEGMLVATVLAALAGKKYIGFIDSDNYFPGAVLEYVKEYSVGFVEGTSDYIMNRISWQSKPKIVESGLFFAKRGRASEHTNRILNRLLSYYTGFGTEIIKTGNAGEHAMTMDLAMKLDYSSGYSIEPYHYINMLEKFGGILGNPDPDILKKGIQLYQIESKNPHLHEVKGDEHVKDMSRAAYEVIHNSPICPDPLKAEIKTDLVNRKLLKEGEDLGSTLKYYPALQTANLQKFADTLKDQPYSKHFKGDLSKYPIKTKETDLVREVVKDKDKNLPDEGGYLEAK